MKGNYKLRFLNKNNKNSDENKPDTIEFDENDNKKINGVFDAFDEGDVNYFEFLASIECNIEFEICQQNNTDILISSSFMNAFLRKICKLGVEWVIKETKDVNSPIKHLEFITDFLISNLSVLFAPN
ncbi:hypothetical protein [Xenorhabdus hominickii]|uniref:Uncharacterized protein n=1 Tax=Xenorhabdus hominickii TaxID=351679 RepID=A0A2G0QA44_XENHO|nr:hypothetical protein [Xenorhabdus hominickii]AOM40921.1 hypothetical protein A9255_10220 [Xenorhabdus hominickii]PHM56105.1 hypothetical protein Xhom_01576 [Xenorhabdus hominickii]